MNNHKYITAFLACTVCFALCACSNHAADKTQTNKVIADSSSTSNLQKDGLAKVYTQAIAEFIKAEYKRNKTSFDTLFFGKHVYGQPDDFPNIELPETIENTHIRLVSPEVGLTKQQERKSLVYVNMMGWVEKEKAGFILVVFSNGSRHQYDYNIDFTYNAARKEFELEKIQFEDYLHSKEAKPK